MIVEISIEGMKPFEARIEESGSGTYLGFNKALPIEGRVMRWGDEIYFYVGFRAPLEHGARSTMKVGEIAYWPDGPALAIFFGPTPASTSTEPEAASECNVIGKTDAPAETLGKAKEGAKIVIALKR